MYKNGNVSLALNQKKEEGGIEDEREINEREKQQPKKVQQLKTPLHR